jgi:hypothetical protein
VILTRPMMQDENAPIAAHRAWADDMAKALSAA